MYFRLPRILDVDSTQIERFCRPRQLHEITDSAGSIFGPSFSFRPLVHVAFAFPAYWNFED
eukprot:CCRYP_018834-RD/>CCRYP_018834-RD protein AED:0.28 eAED:0.28 QI:1979/0.5/0.66/1/0.5/0.33/3/0/60